MNIYFIYLDWTLEEVPRAFYVGKGMLQRIGRRERENDHWKRIARKHGCRREIVFATKDEAFAFDEEKRLIREHKTFYGHPDYVWGANKTEGGEGPAGFTWSDEMRRQASLLRIGVSHTEAHSRKISSSMQGNANGKCRSHTKASRALLSEKLRGTSKTQRRLTWDDVRAIRASQERSTILSDCYGVTRQTINAIRAHRIWVETSA